MGKQKNTSINKLTISLACLILFFLGSIAYIMVAASGGKKKSPLKNVNPEESVMEETKNQETHFAVLKGIDTKELSIILYDITTESTVNLQYTGGTDIRNKYDDIISANQLEEGILVDVTYDEYEQKLKSLKISKDAWEYTGVTNFEPNRSKHTVSLYGEKYQYDSKIYVRNADGDTTLLSINHTDKLTVRGYEKKIYSIVVTKGHGSLALSNAEYFEGGTLTIGAKDYTNITADMVFTVQEGETKVSIEKDGTRGETMVEIIRDKEVRLDLSPYLPEPEQKGEVVFMIRPYGADLYIDGELTSYSDAVEITYGEHSIKVALNGYESYEGTYMLAKSSDIVQIQLSKTAEPTNDNEVKVTPTPPVNMYPTTVPSQSVVTPSVPTPSVPTPTPSLTPVATQDPSKGSKEVDKNHTLKIKGPEGATVYINGVYRGIAPLTIDKPIGVIYVTFVKEGYQQITHTVDIPDDSQDKTYSFPSLEANQ